MQIRPPVRVLLVVALAWLAWGWLGGTAADAAGFPVRYSSDSRYLVDRDGIPFPILGRSAWVITSRDVSEHRVFLDDTVARGFNAIEFHVTNHDPRGNHVPFDAAGSTPFLKRLDGEAWTGKLTYDAITREAPDFTTPNDDYWRRVDELIASCESRGILVLMFPAYVGFQGGKEGWMQEIVANGPDRMRNYGAWLAARYRERANIVWMMGGDMGTGPNGFDAVQTSAEAGLLAGLRSVPEQRSTMFSAEWNSDSIATDQPDFGAAMTLNGAYSWSGAVVGQGRRAYAQVPPMPAYLLEEPYDEEGPDHLGVNPSATDPVRRFEWWGWLSTIGGYVAGNGYVWPFRDDSWWTMEDVSWRAHLNTPGSRDLAQLNAFIRSVPWYKLVPSGFGGMRRLVVAGGSAPEASDYVAAAAAPDGSLLVAYVPPAHRGSIGVDVGAMGAAARARWLDPTTGAGRPVEAAAGADGILTVEAPGRNGRGDTDWVLVIESGG